MAERRPLTSAIQNFSGADPEIVRQFITQERPNETPKELTPSVELAENSPASQSTSTSPNEVDHELRPMSRPSSATPKSYSSSTAQKSFSSAAETKKKSKSTGLVKLGLVPVTVRLSPTLAGALKRASLERQLAGEEMYTQQEILEQIIEPWLKEEGYLT